MKRKVNKKEKKRICKPRNGECVDPARYDIYGCFGCPFGD